MLRSLDPDKNFEAPKSKKLEPTEKEKAKFSEGELQHIEQSLEFNTELLVGRRVVKIQREAVLKDLEKK